MNSIYIWDDTLQNDTETVMIAKTVKAKVSAVIETVRQMHSYDCPCVLALARGGRQSGFSWDGSPDKWRCETMPGRL